MLRFNPRRLRSALALVFVALAAASGALAAEALPHSVMPAPTEYRAGPGRLPVTAAFSIQANLDEPRLRAAVERALQRWSASTGLTFAREAKPGTATLVITCETAGTAVPQLGDNESYVLEISGTQANLRAPTVLGALRGLETWQQLLASDADGWFVPAATIRDQPRFPWRGLLVDPARHWLPVDAIKRTLDTMAVVKLNVLHWHLTDDQGFRVESKKYPKLHELGSDGLYYTQEQIREVVAYAAHRGIRVLPEFDVPGHTTSWLVAYPELASAPGPYAIERRWGVKDPVLNPINEKTFELLDGFFGEMAALFPEAYLHIGGDENNGKHWSLNAEIQAFIAKKNLRNNVGMHTHFNARLRGILAKHGKKLIGWDEILHADLARDSVVHSWRGAKGLAEAAKMGFPVLLSNGYYLDHALPAWKHYANDPLPANSPLTPEEQARVLGGEAALWGEWVTAETLDARLWPRAAAIAERLWSPREITSVPDLYRRLAAVSGHLEAAGSLHEKNPAFMLRRLAGLGATPAALATLQTFASTVETGALSVRGRATRNTATQQTPLTTFADALKSESESAREFSVAVDAYVFNAGPRDPALAQVLQRQLAGWHQAGVDFGPQLASLNPRLQELSGLAENLVTATALGREALDALGSGRIETEARALHRIARLDRAVPAPALGVTSPLIAPLRVLVAAATLDGQRSALPPNEWRSAVEKLATSRPALEKPPSLSPVPPATKS